MLNKYITSVLYWCIISLGCNGQFYSTGTAPSSLKWEKLSTENFRIIYPQEIKEEALNYARQLEFYKPYSENGMNINVRKFPVILYNTSVLSNGYVTRAPGRMELVTTPPRNSYSLPWSTQLVLHEYRHAAQLQKFNQGTTRIWSWISGEIAIGTSVSLMPAWFYEGDAVYNETILSESGRGRVAEFEMPLRTLLSEKKPVFSYDKAVFGSYRDHVPDHYRYGYYMVQFAVNQYGSEVWPKAIDYSARNPFLIWPLAFYLKKNHGIYKSGLYDKTMDSLKIQYNNIKDSDTYSKYSIINSQIKRSYTSYTNPLALSDDQYVCLKSGLDFPMQFILIDKNGTENKLLITGYTSNIKSDLKNNILIWDEVVSDKRWEQQSFSEIVSYNLTSHKRKRITRRTRYFSPDFSPDGALIAVAESNLSGNNFLTLLDAGNGRVTNRFSVPGNREIQFPEWIDEHLIMFVTVSAQGRQVELYDLKKKAWSVLIPYTWKEISEILNYKDYIILRGSFKGIDNILAFHVSDNKSYQLTFSEYGAFNPSLSPDSSFLLFTEYSAMGYNITEIPLRTNLWREVDLFENTGIKRNLINSSSSPTMEISDSLSDDGWSVKPYRKFLNTFHPHSWLPFYFDWNDALNNISDTKLYPGFMLFSQNLLSTVTSSIGYKFNHGQHSLFPVIYLRGWYPVIEWSAQYSNKLRTLPLPEGVPLPSSSDYYYDWNLRTYIPLTYNRGNYQITLKPEVEYERSGIWYLVNNTFIRDIDYVHLKIHAFAYNRLSVRDLYPRWGQYLSAIYTFTPSDVAQFGQMWSVSAGLFFPGLFPHHHIWINGGIQQQYPVKYYLPYNRISFPRGFQPVVSKNFKSVQINYALPLLYPDLSLGPFLYLKRIRSTFFYDYAYGNDIRENSGKGISGYTGRYTSYGLELFADTHIIRFIFPISLGIQTGYMPDRKHGFANILFSINTGIL